MAIKRVDLQGLEIFQDHRGEVDNARPDFLHLFCGVLEPGGSISTRIFRGLGAVRYGGTVPPGPVDRPGDLTVQREEYSVGSAPSDNTGCASIPSSPRVANTYNIRAHCISR